jgi:hypothetical protein
VRRLRGLPAAVFAGDRRVWLAALTVAIPLLLLLAFYCVKPRDYYTGTNSVEADSYVAEASRGQSLCVPGLQLPADTARIRLQVISQTTVRPALRMRLQTGGRTIDRALASTTVEPSRVSAAVFTVPQLHRAQAASLCVQAGGVVNWGGTPLVVPPSPAPPTLNGKALAARVAVWYLPRAGAQRSYLSRIGKVLARASLFRPGLVGPWLYVLIFFVLLPALAIAAVRCLALAVAGRGPRAPLAWLFVLAALNFASWAVITPAFQAPDEIDHFAYTQSLVERGKAPARDAGSPLPRWSSSENLALEDSSFLTDHQVGDTRAPWTIGQQRFYEAQVHKLRPRGSDGGGNETAATHGPIYYAALAPGYFLASASPFSQLTLMRLTSALIGALTVIFTYLLASELAPGRRWIAVLAALIVAYEPMYGFISGAVNNDVGVDAGAACLEWLLIRMLRRGVNVRWGILTGLVLLLLPIVKGTAYSLYPVAAITVIFALWRRHRRADLLGWAGFAGAVVVFEALSKTIAGLGQSAGSNTPGLGSTAGATGGAAEHPLGFLAYLWEVFLPRLSFMAPHFENTSIPAFTIFVERGWGAFGWYDVFFPRWLFIVILIAMLAVPVLGVVALVRERQFVHRRLLEAVILVLMPIAVVVGFEAAFYTPSPRPAIAEFGRYAFPAIAPLAVIAVASLQAFGRRGALLAGAGVLVAMIALSYAGQLTTLAGFYA